MRNERGKPGHPQTPETRAKIAAAIRGRKRPPEVLAKVSAALRGRKLSPEHVEKIRRRMTGSKMSAETKAKISAALAGRKLSLQTRKRQSLAAMMTLRAERLNEKLANDPALAARVRARRREGQAKCVAAVRQERAQRPPRAILGPIAPEIYAAWERTRDLSRGAP